jgi:hypothetical protein
MPGARARCNGLNLDWGLIHESQAKDKRLMEFSSAFYLLIFITALHIKLTTTELF